MTARDLWVELDAFDQQQHAALEQDRALARTSALLTARAEAATARGRELIECALTALQRAHRDGAYHLSLIQAERVVRCRYAKNAKLHVIANVVREAAEEALRSAGLEVIRTPGSSWDLDVCRPRAARDSAPPSTTRPLLAADKEFQRLRALALDAFGEIAGTFGPGIQRLAGPDLSSAQRRELSDIAKDLSWAAYHPSEGKLPRVAETCAQLARDVAFETKSEGLAVACWKAAEACIDLARYADEWAIRQAGGVG